MTILMLQILLVTTIFALDTPGYDTYIGGNGGWEHLSYGINLDDPDFATLRPIVHLRASGLIFLGKPKTLGLICPMDKS